MCLYLIIFTVFIKCTAYLSIDAFLFWSPNWGDIYHLAHCKCSLCPYHRPIQMVHRQSSAVASWIWHLYYMHSFTHTKLGSVHFGWDLCFLIHHPCACTWFASLDGTLASIVPWWSVKSVCIGFYNLWFMRLKISLMIIYSLLLSSSIPEEAPM